MARMPTRDDLPQAIASANTAVVRAPTNNVGASIAGFGDTLGGMARVLARANREEQKKNGVMERAKATAFLQRGLIDPTPTTPIRTSLILRTGRASTRRVQPPSLRRLGSTSLTRRSVNCSCSKGPTM